VDGVRLGGVVRSRARAALALLGGLALANGPTARAQISPGPLSRPHSSLEGSGQCAQCHEPGRGVAAEKCLECHRPLARRIGEGRGLHSRPDHRDCKLCHVEHQGTEFELVWWGEAGREAFDHARAGYVLEGRHARLGCRDCHLPRLNHDEDSLAEAGVNLTRTYLGLGTACTDCHVDGHRGQFADRACTSCHDQTAWRPAPGFDHAQTSWPLTGRHAAVACVKCHREGAADRAHPEDRHVLFKSVSGRDCVSCHEDVHRARLGSACADCHSTTGWRRVERARFDHGRTRYPLEGRHAEVSCERCHRPGATRALRYERCTDCHADAHFGQLADRPDKGACEACHTVEGFSPARYGLEEHQRTSYPLVGAHVAVPCNACHLTTSVAELREIAGVRVPGTASGRSPRLRFATTGCADCHDDPHHGELDRWVSQGGCESCHSETSWRAATRTFDHSRTRFALTAAHAEAACVACHRKVDTGTERERVQLAGAPLTCQGCHQDPHRGQFHASGGDAACDRCHDPGTLKASRFDHGRDSRWPLDGAHRRTACEACHRPESRDGAVFVRYKPLPTACRGCHTGSRFRERAHDE
jgi:hypothetical protein